MDFSVIWQALASPRSTIIVSSLGRYPSVLEHYLGPLLFPLGNENDEQPAWFEFDRHSIYVWIEPSFGTTLPSHLRHLVFTSHLDLHWDPRKTHVVRFEETPLLAGLDDDDYTGLLFVPGRQHPFLLPEDATRLTVDLRRVDDAHDAFLRIRAFRDVWKGEWALLLSPRLRRRIKNLRLR